MKAILKINFLLLGLALSYVTTAQTPQAFKYQTVVRNAAGDILQNQNVSFRFIIHDVNPAGTVVYSETHSVVTNEFGLVSLNIGSGVPVLGTFSAIDWGSAYKFLETELDPAGGNSFTSMGTSQLLSVPYALYSENTANNDDADSDPDNELQTLAIDGNNLSISEGNTVTLPGSGINNRISDDDGDTWIDVERTGDNDSIIFTTFGMERMKISNNGYVQVSGQIIATGFQGDGSGLTGIPGDDLGDHTATADLNMNGNAITNLDDPQLDSDAANKGYVDAQPGDNLGNHTATQNLVIGNNWISNDGNIEGIHIDTDGNVGINNAIPDQELTVSGNIRSTDQVFAGFGSSSIASYRFGTGYENSGLSSPLANSVAVITDGTQRMIVTQNGNIGIGTNNPEKNLHIQGTFRLADGSQANGRVLTSDANGTAFWTEPTPLVQNEWHITGNAGTVDGTNFIGTTDNVAVNFRVNNAEAGRIGRSEDGSVFLGYQAGLNDDLSDNRNTFIGYLAGLSNTTGNYNTANGYLALNSNTTGYDNTANGYAALYSNTTGYDNTANGYQALYSNKANYGSVAVGYNAMYYADDRTTGRMTYNTAIGFGALRGSTTAANNTGQWNTSVGYQSLYSNTSGYSNTANGVNALSSNTTGNQNTANGVNALYSNTTGNYNTANGFNALSSNTTASYNTANGVNALYSNTTGYSNTANGYRALFSNTTGNYNTANGYAALYSNTTGYYNTANGFDALSSNTTGYNNTANGSWALFSNTTGYSNTANGVNALSANTTGYENTANGVNALSANTTGSYNTANGVNALYSNSDGTFNTALGYHAFFTGSSYTNSTGIGYDAEPGASNRVRVGNTSVNSIGGQVGWTAFSDGRIKTNVQENVAGLDFIMKLRPVTYHFDKNKQDELMGVVDSSKYAEKYDIEKIQFSGFIAQEVEQAAQQIGYDFSGVDKSGVKNGGLYGLRYAEFVVPLVKAVKEQQQMIDDLRNENEVLRNEIDTIKQMILNK